MSSGALILAPLSLGNAVEPLIDFMWHYECVVSPRSACSGASNVESPTNERSPLSNQSEGEGKTISPSHAESLELRGSQTATSNREKGWRSVLDNPENIPGDGELNASSARSSHDLSISARRVRRALSEESLFPLKGKEIEISSTELNILGANRKWLQRVFDTFDENGDGKISKDELRRSLEKLGIHMPDESIVSILTSVSVQTEGHVNANEFFLLYQTTCSLIDDLCEEPAGDSDKDLLEAFNVFDKNRDGFISATELQTVLSSLGFSQAGELAVCEEMIRRVDENGKGKVDFFEFKKMMTSPSTALAAF